MLVTMLCLTAQDDVRTGELRYRKRQVCDGGRTAARILLRAREVLADEQNRLLQLGQEADGNKQDSNQCIH